MQVSYFWKILSVIGYNIRGSTNTERYIGSWSDGSPTKVEVGVWGDFEPNTPIGSCARVDKSHDNKWYMESCDRLLPSVCELTPCPDGMYEVFKFIYSGICLNRTSLGWAIVFRIDSSLYTDYLYINIIKCSVHTWWFWLIQTSVSTCFMV